MIASFLIAFGFVVGLAIALMLINVVIDRPGFEVPRWLGLLYLVLVCLPPVVLLDNLWRFFNRPKTISLRRS